MRNSAFVFMFASTVAEGQGKDEVVTSLQNQINELKTQIEALKSSRSEN